MSTDDLLTRMATVLQMSGQWQARAVGSTVFHAGATPREAMQRALGLAHEPAALTITLPDITGEMLAAALGLPDPGEAQSVEPDPADAPPAEPDDAADLFA